MSAVLKAGQAPAPQSDAVMRVVNLHKSYGEREVVRGMDFSIARGECYGLLGPNGAGKTTTLRLCLGLIEPAAGSIDILGHAIPADARRARARIGVVPQIDNLDPDFTADENLVVYGRYFGMSDDAIRARIPMLLDFAGLTGRENDRIQTLSGGMKRRLTMARALVNDPDIIFMDEPTTGLDPQARHLIWERLKTLVSQGKTLLLTTHFMDEAERLCSRLAIMDNGRIIAEGSPRELVRRHIEPEVIEAFGEGTKAWAKKAEAMATRVEVTGETVFCYTSDARPLLAALEGEQGFENGGLRYMHRLANLEDVFLKLTGRDLRD